MSPRSFRRRDTGPALLFLLPLFVLVLGLLARAIQHEVDHLNGLLFIDRMAKADKEDLKPELEALQKKTKAALKSRS